MLGDVGHPQLVRAVPGALTVDQVDGDLVGLGMAPLRPAGGADQASAAHQQRDGVVAYQDPAAQSQLGVHSQSPVGAAGVPVNLTIRSVSQAWRIARAEGGRARQA